MKKMLSLFIVVCTMLSFLPATALAVPMGTSTPTALPSDTDIQAEETASATTLPSDTDISAEEIVDAPLFAMPPMLRSGPTTDMEIAAAIYAYTGVAAGDTDWVKYIKDSFAQETDITSAASGAAITWASVPDSGVSAPWDGTKLDVGSAVPVPATDTDLVETQSTSGTVTTTTYTIGGTTVLEVVEDSAKTDNEAKEYHIYTAEALAYVMQQFVLDAPGTAYLEKDIDLNGQYHNWFRVYMDKGQIFDGKGHTVYNLYANNLDPGVRSGFICVGDKGMALKNTTFQNGYVIGKGNSGIVGWVEDNGTPNTLSNVHVKDFMTVVSTASGSAGALSGRVEGASTVENCSAENCVSFGGQHIGSLTAAVVGKTGSPYAQVSNCYSVGCTVFSTGEHSGGLISCGGNVDIKNCFTDVLVYGSKKTGVFCGALNGVCTVENCFASGFIEGSNIIGGFIGLVENYGGARCTFTNCYTTALVGLRAGGTSLGGFVGYTDGSYITANFKDCYAAGEVGSTDTVVTPPAAPTDNQKQSSGGFIGTQGMARNTYVNCYYDKQTTAMREWGVGQRVAKQDYSGIHGVLTTETVKSGAGLMDEPGVTGFTGFAAPEAWNCTTVDHYPQLTAFSEADQETWGDEETATLVRAYSLSSTAGIKLETWDYGYATDTGLRSTATSLEDTTYCTVRDLTSGFDLSSAGGDDIAWMQVAQQLNKTEQKATVIIAGNTYEVLSLKQENGRWFCDSLIPGVEWLRVKETVDGQAATRRLRVIPTASIEAGASVSVTEKPYDHADDVSMFFSTAARMGKDGNDITTGAFPDEPLVSAQTALMENGRDAIPDVADMDDQFTKVPVGRYMSEVSTDNANNSQLYVYAYRVADIDDTTSEIKLGEQIDFTADDTRLGGSNLYSNQFNGKTLMTNVDDLYLVAYLWVLQDGRALQDAKLVQRASVPFDVTLDVYRDSVGTDNLYTGGVKTYVGTASPADLGTAVTMTDSPQADAKVSAYVDAVAAWQQTYSEDTIKSIYIKLNIAGREYEQTVTNPVEGTSITITTIAYRIVYRDGDYYTIPETVERTYTLQKNGNIWYLAFNKHETVTTGYGDSILINDVEMDIDVDVVMSSNHVPPDPPEPPVPTGKLTVTKTSTPSGVKEGAVITYSITLENTGRAAVADVKVRDYIPQYTQLMRGSITGGGVYGIIDGKYAVTWNVPSVAAGETVVLSFKVKIDICLPKDCQIFNTAYYNTNDPSAPNSPTDPGTPTNTVVNKGVYSVKTGDSFSMLLYRLLLDGAVLGIIMLISARYLRRKRCLK